jgi:hypothetical protein
MGGENGCAAAAREREADCGNDDRAGHHEGERRIPRAENIEEAEHFAGSVMPEIKRPSPKTRPPAKLAIMSAMASSLK